MRVVVFGGGAVGSVLAARIAPVERDVLLVGRRAHVEAIENAGLYVEGLPNQPVRLRALPEIPPGYLADGLLLTVKGFDLESAVRSFAGSLARPTPILALQNGLGIEERVAVELSRAGWPDGGRWVIRAVHSIPATFLGPGRVRLAGEGEVLFGAEGGVDVLREAFPDLLLRAGVRVRIVESIGRAVWEKALLNAAINPVTADQRVLNGKLTEDPWRGRALSLLHEARRVAASEGYEFTEEEAERELFRVIRATANNRSSMLQDVEARRPTEIEEISGAILEAGRRHGLDLPYTRRAVERIRSRVARERASA